MGDSYLGRNSIYGLFEKQALTLVSTVTDYSLLWKVGSAASLLVVADNTVLEPNVDYEIIIDGQTISFAPGILVTPPTNTYVVFLGKQLSVPRTAGIEPVLETPTTSGGVTQFPLSHNVVNDAAIIVFVNGVQQILGVDFNLIVVGSTKTVEFAVAPTAGADLAFYIHGVERFDSAGFDTHCIINQYLADSCVDNRTILDNTITGDKINSTWTTYVPEVHTMAGMTIVGSPTISLAKFKKIDAGALTVKLDITCQFGGIADNRIRFGLPSLYNAIDEVCGGSVFLSTNVLDEVGVIKLGGLTYIDILRDDGINYTLGEDWRFRIRTTFEF